MKISQERLMLLNKGEIAINNLAEGLAIDFATLMRSALPTLPESVVETMHASASLGILQRMNIAGVRR